MDNYEAERIKQEAEKRVKRAEALGLKEIFNYLYFHKIQCNSWAGVEDNRNYLSPTLTDVVELKEEGVGKKVKMTLKGRNYIIAFESHRVWLPDNDSFTSGNMILYLNDKKILALSASQSEYDKYEGGGEWNFFKIDGFVEGDWVNDFKELEAISRQYDEKNQEEYEQKKKIDDAEKLKKDFGID